MLASFSRLFKNKKERMVVFFGPPGAGKGTQAQILEKEFNLCQISTGDALRAEIRAQTPLGKRVKGIIDDDTVMEILQSSMEQHQDNKGFIFDGIPRTIGQVHKLDALLDRLQMPLTHVLYLQVNVEELKMRVCGRLFHPASGRVYHIVYNPPKVEGKDDETGEDLVQRPDDQEETIRKRLGSYHTETEQLVGFYQGRAASGENAPTYDKLNGLRPIENVQTDLFAILDQSK